MRDVLHHIALREIIGWALVAVGLSGFGYVVVRHHIALRQINAMLRDLETGRKSQS